MRDSKAGICLRGGRNVLVEGNYCHGTYGIRVYGDGHRIINNCLEETEGGISLDAGQYRAGEFVDREASGSYQAASDVLVSHNTIVTPRGSGINLGHRRGQKHSGLERNELPERIMFVNNLVTGQADVLISDEGSRHVTWKSKNIALATGETKIGLLNPGVVKLNPELVFQAVRYLPGARSPVKDAGTSSPEVTTDYSGLKRAGLPDIGCDEAVQGGIVRRPLRPTDVGPSWCRAESSNHKPFRSAKILIHAAMNGLDGLAILTPKARNRRNRFLPIPLEPQTAVVHVTNRRRFMGTDLVHLDLILLEPRLDRPAALFRG